MANLPMKLQKYIPNPIYAVPTWAEENEVVHMIVEINKGGINKYEMITETGMLMLDRVGYSSIAYPFAYGAIPQTMDEDNDPLDIMLPFITEPLVPGSLLEARVIGVMEMIDSNEVDDKIIAIPNNDKRLEHIKDLSDLPDYLIKETRYFWEHYKDMKGEKLVEIKEFKGKKEAVEIINKCKSVFEKDYMSKFE